MKFDIKEHNRSVILITNNKKEMRCFIWLFENNNGQVFLCKYNRSRDPFSMRSAIKYAKSINAKPLDCLGLIISHCDILELDKDFFDLELEKAKRMVAANLVINENTSEEQFYSFMNDWVMDCEFSYKGGITL